MEYSLQMQNDIKSYLEDKKNGLDLVDSCNDKSISIEKIITRFQTLALEEYIGDLKAKNEWRYSPRLTKIREGAVEYEKGKYSSYFLMENRIGTLRIPLVASLSCPKKLFKPDAKVEGYEEIKSAIKNAYGIKVNENAALKTLLNARNNKVSFAQRVYAGDKTPRSLCQYDKIVEILDLVCQKELKDLTKKDKTLSPNVLFASEVYGLMKLCLAEKLGEKVYSALSLQFCNVIATLNNDFEIKKINEIGNKIFANACEKLELKTLVEPYVRKYEEKIEEKVEEPKKVEEKVKEKVEEKVEEPKKVADPKAETPVKTEKPKYSTLPKRKQDIKKAYDKIVIKALGKELSKIDDKLIDGGHTKNLEIRNMIISHIKTKYESVKDKETFQKIYTDEYLANIEASVKTILDNRNNLLKDLKDKHIEGKTALDALNIYSRDILKEKGITSLLKRELKQVEKQLLNDYKVNLKKNKTKTLTIEL